LPYYPDLLLAESIFWLTTERCLSEGCVYSTTVENSLEKREKIEPIDAVKTQIDSKERSKVLDCLVRW
jgi:hypothetical protein